MIQNGEKKSMKKFSTRNFPTKNFSRRNFPRRIFSTRNFPRRNFFKFIDTKMESVVKENPPCFRLLENGSLNHCTQALDGVCDQKMVYFLFQMAFGIDFADIFDGQLLRRHFFFIFQRLRWNKTKNQSTINQIKKLNWLIKNIQMDNLKEEKQKFDHSINQSITRSTIQSINQSINRPINQSIEPWFKRSKNQSINQVNSRSISKRTYQPINRQSTDVTVPDWSHTLM